MKHGLFNTKSFSLIFTIQSVPGVGGDKEEDSGLTREEQQEQEKLRWDSLGF